MQIVDRLKFGILKVVGNNLALCTRLHPVVIPQRLRFIFNDGAAETAIGSASKAAMALPWSRLICVHDLEL
jgi:hypothetical protein